MRIESCAVNFLKVKISFFLTKKIKISYFRVQNCSFWTLNMCPFDTSEHDPYFFTFYVSLSLQIEQIENTPSVSQY